MPRHLLTSTPPSGNGTAADGADGIPAPAHRRPVPARRSLITLFAILLVAWVGVAGVG